MSKTVTDLSLRDLKEIASKNTSKEIQQVEINTTARCLNNISKNFLDDTITVEKETVNFKRISLTVNSVKFILKAKV